VQTILPHLFNGAGSLITASEGVPLQSFSDAALGEAAPKLAATANAQKKSASLALDMITLPVRPLARRPGA